MKVLAWMVLIYSIFTLALFITLPVWGLADIIAGSYFVGVVVLAVHVIRKKETHNE